MWVAFLRVPITRISVFEVLFRGESPFWELGLRFKQEVGDPVYLLRCLRRLGLSLWRRWGLRGLLLGSGWVGVEKL